jgi:hypothetical protein
MAHFLFSVSVSVMVWSRDGVGVKQCGVDATCFMLSSLHVLFAPSRHQPLYPYVCVCGDEVGGIMAMFWYIVVGAGGGIIAMACCC